MSHHHSGSKRRIVGNLLVLATGQVGTWLSSSLGLVLLSRYLGPDRLGILSLGTSVATVLGLLVGLGMDTFITRSIARAPERTSELLSAAVVVRAAMAVPAAVALLAYTNLAHLSGETRLVCYLAYLGMVIGSLSSIQVAALQGHERMSLATIGPVIANLLDLGVIVVAIALHGRPALFMGLTVLVGAMALMINVAMVRRATPLAFMPRLSKIREVVSGSLAFWASSVFLTFYIYVDSVILGSVAGTQAVGIYAPATRLFSVALFLPALLGTATFPLLSRLGVDQGGDFRRAARKAVMLLVLCAVPITIGLASFSGPLIGAVFGPGYWASVPVLVVLSFCIPATFLSIQAAQVLAARNQQWRWTAIMAASCVLNPLANLALIPRASAHWHNGALGAALALLATELLMAAYAVTVLAPLLLDRGVIRSLNGTLAAGVAEVGMLYLGHDLWPPLNQALALCTFLVLAMVLGALPRTDLVLLWDIGAQPVQRLRGLLRRLARWPGRSLATGPAEES